VFPWVPKGVPNSSQGFPNYQTLGTYGNLGSLAYLCMGSLEFLKCNKIWVPIRVGTLGNIWILVQGTHGNPWNRVWNHGLFFYIDSRCIRKPLGTHHGNPCKYVGKCPIGNPWEPASWGNFVYKNRNDDDAADTVPGVTVPTVAAAATPLCCLQCRAHSLHLYTVHKGT
jgi:hypothetical protein